jgi:hypothetical protein
MHLAALRVGFSDLSGALHTLDFQNKRDKKLRITQQGNTYLNDLTARIKPLALLHKTSIPFILR